MTDKRITWRELLDRDDWVLHATHKTLQKAPGVSSVWSSEYNTSNLYMESEKSEEGRFSICGENPFNSFMLAEDGLDHDIHHDIAIYIEVKP